MYRIAPSACRRRGLPAIGVALEAPDGIEVTPIATGETIVRCCQRDGDGRTIGELDVSVFSAALIIDRDGILEEKARSVAEAAPACEVTLTVAVALPGSSGYRADAHERGRERSALPYLYVFAMASHDLGVGGGVVIRVRSARPEWPVAEAILRSVRLSNRLGVAAKDDAEQEPLLPVVRVTK